MHSILCCALVLVVGCGARTQRPTQVGGGYTYAYRRSAAGGLEAGHGARFDAVFPRERGTPRLSLGVAREGTDAGDVAFVDGKIDWYANHPSTPEGLVFDVAVGFGWSAFQGSDIGGYGPSVHGLVELEYRVPEWSIVANATFEGALIGGLTNGGEYPDAVGGIPVFLGVRHAVE